MGDGVTADPGSADRADSAALEAPFVTLDDFMPVREAAAMRAAIDAHFANPQDHEPGRHQVWNYWHVPQLYTYLRTSPEKVIPHALVMHFYQALSVFARERLGLGHVSWPNLSLYVDGCEQHLHNDSANGRLGYVYSLTRDARKTIGGDTILLREGDLFRDNMAKAAAGPGLYQLIEPSFNRLTLFDDRIPHGVSRVEGSMDPVEGRFVLHGHVSESGIAAEGALDAGILGRAIGEQLTPLLADAADCHGPLTFRVSIDTHGRTEKLAALLNRVARADGRSARPIVERVLAAVSAMRWPDADASTEAVVPILFGGPLPWMKA